MRFSVYLQNNYCDIRSVFLYQGDPQHRAEVAQSVGPFLIEILKLLNLTTWYLPIVGLIVVLAFVILLKQHTYDQIMHFSFLSMIILPFYATELFITLPFFFWFKEGFKAFTDSSQVVKVTRVSSQPK